jgi:hypothetical protein
MDLHHHLVPTRVQLAAVAAVATMVLKEEMAARVVAVQEHPQILKLSPAEMAAHLQIQVGLQEDLQVELELVIVVLEAQELVQSVHLQPRVFPVLGE